MARCSENRKPHLSFTTIGSTPNPNHRADPRTRDRERKGNCSPAVESKHLPRNMPNLFGLRVRRPLSRPSNPKLGARLVQEAQTKRELANVPYLVHPNPQRPRGTRQLTLKTKTKNHQKELGADADFKEKRNYKKLLGVDQIVSSTPPSAHSRPCQGRPFGCAASGHPTRTAPRGGSARSSVEISLAASKPERNQIEVGPIELHISTEPMGANKQLFSLYEVWSKCGVVLLVFSRE